MRTEAEFNELPTQSPCKLCGGPTLKTYYTIKLVSADGEELAQPICEECVKLGPAAAAHRMSRYAKELRQHADRLEALASDVEAIPAHDWASVQDAQDLVQAVFQQHWDDFLPSGPYIPDPDA